MAVGKLVFKGSTPLRGVGRPHPNPGFDKTQDAGSLCAARNQVLHELYIPKP